MSAPNPAPATERESLRALLGAATPRPWDGAAEPEFVGLFAAPEPEALADYLGEIRSHANARLVLALVNGIEALLADALAASAAKDAEIARLKFELGNARAINASLLWDDGRPPVSRLETIFSSEAGLCGQDG